MKRETGIVIRAYRIRAGLSQDALVSRIRLSKVYLSEIENGKKLPSLAVLHKIARATGTSLTSMVKAIEDRLPHSPKELP